MADELTMRDVRPDDVRTLEDIAAAAWVPVFTCWEKRLGQDVFPHVYGDWEQQKRAQIRKACDPDDRAVMLVAEIDGRIVGFISYYLDESRRIGEIGNNAVHPDFQGRGIGPRMYARVLERMRQAGMKVAKVLTGLDEAHIPARRAYEKVGFAANLQSIEYYQAL